MKKNFKREVNQMTTQILAHLSDLLSNESESNYHIEVTNENATEFFTALNNAACHILIKTGMVESFLDAQHLYNKLLFRYLMEDKEK